MTKHRRSAAFAAALLSCVLIAPGAHADGAGYYLSGSIGGLVLPGQNLDGSGGTIDLNYVPGLVGGGAIGYELPVLPVRLEAEVMYRSIDPDTITALAGTPIITGTTFTATGSLDVVSAMGNAYAFLPVPFGFEPYVGVGVGYARVKANGLAANGTTLVDGQADGVAYQGIIGVELDFIPGPIDVGIEYRYFAVEPVSLSGPSGAFDFKYESHSAMLRLRLSL